MASGSLYRAVARTGGLKPVVDTVRGIIAEKKRRDTIQKVVDLMSGTGRDLDRIATSKEERLFIPNPTGSIIKNNTALVGENLTPEEKYKRGQLSVNNALAKLFSDQDVIDYGNPNQINMLSNLLQQKLQAYKPEQPDIMPVNKNTSAFFDKESGKMIPNPFYTPDVKKVERIISDEPSGDYNIVTKGYVNPDVDPAQTLFTFREQEEQKPYDKKITSEEVAKTVREQNLKDIAGKPKDYALGDFDIVETSRTTQKRRDSKKGSGTGSGEVEGTGIDEVDYSSDWANVTQGINIIKELKDKPIDKEGNIEILDSNGDAKKVSTEEFKKLKEIEKESYTKSALDMVKKYDLKTQRNLMGAIAEIRKYKKGDDWETPYQKFFEKNPDMTEEEQDLVRKYFEIHTL